MSIHTSRNVLVWGEENQRKLYNTSIAVVGSDVLAQMVLTGLAGLGIGKICFIDNKRIARDDLDFLVKHDDINIGDKKIRHIENTLSLVNPNLDFIGIYSKFVEAFIYPYQPQIIIDATNDAVSKETVLKYAVSYGIPIISASSNAYQGEMAVYFPKKKTDFARNVEPPDLETLILDRYQEQTQGSFTSGVIAGLVCEEVRKTIFRYENEHKSNMANNSSLIYNLLSDSRRGSDNDQHQLPVYYKNKRALIVGAGGIGNYVALNLALLGVGKIDIVDYDIVEPHNLNRQILLYDRVGEKKSDILAERIKEIDKHIQATSIYGKIAQTSLEKDKVWLEEVYEFDRKLWEQDSNENKDPNFPNFKEFRHHYFGVTEQDRQNYPGIKTLTPERLAKTDYDVIFGCVDNKYTRLWLNNFAINNGLTYIDGGTGPQRGVMAVYQPGKSDCIDCQLHLSTYPRISMSCAQQPDGSVVMSNMVIGSAMVGESIRTMFSFDVLKTDFRYDPLSQQRFYLRKRRNTQKNHHC